MRKALHKWQMTSQLHVSTTCDQSFHLRIGLQAKNSARDGLGGKAQWCGQLVQPHLPGRAGKGATLFLLRASAHCLPIRCLRIHLQHCPAAPSRIDSCNRGIWTSFVYTKLTLPLNKYWLSICNMHSPRVRAGNAKKNKYLLLDYTRFFRESAFWFWRLIHKQLQCDCLRRSCFCHKRGFGIFHHVFAAKSAT